VSGHPTAGVDSCRGFSVGCLHVSPIGPQPKRLHQMNRFEDVGPFPGGGLNWSNDQCDGLMLEGSESKTAASLRTFFLLVISAEALKSLVPFLGIFELGMPKTPCYVRVFWSKSLLPDFQRSFKKRLGLRIPIFVLRSSLLVDDWNLIPGESWQAAIEEALGQFDTCLVFFGPHGLGPFQSPERPVDRFQRCIQASRHP
jgi:hypothetical protein